VARLSRRIETARRALSLLEELARRSNLSDIERDASIQRFEYTFEAVWKTAQLYLREVHGVDVGSPKATARASLQTHILDESETRAALLMVDDRNLTVHTYDERVARQIASRLGDHAVLMRSWLDRMEPPATGTPELTAKP